ncbi:MAG TPA: holo-ACP synthase [Thermoanaerobaculia bacterium]
MKGLLLGLDLTEVARVSRLLERWGARFLDRVFLPGEILLRRRHSGAFAEHVAGRFAAKEAAMKALGTGFRGVAFKEIFVGREASGKPCLEFRGRALDRARALNVRAAEVSITHARTMAAAAVVLLTEE